MQNSVIEQLPNDITCIDTGLNRPGLAACYLMRQGDSAAVIETGTRHTVPRILELLDKNNLAREQVRYVIVTHVHLDHAGGAGELMQHLPDARLVVHPRGASHMIDPAKLQAGTEAVYGKEVYRRTYGDLVPVAEDRIVVAEDGARLNLENRPLLFVDTPGHARHHFCVYDELSSGIFSGDTMGLVYRELNQGFKNFVIPTTTPVQFDPEALRQSVRRLMALQPQRLYLTHFGMVEDVERHAEQLLRSVEHYVSIASTHAEDDHSVRQKNIESALLRLTLTQLRENGTTLNDKQATEVLMLDMDLNSQGLNYWLEQQGDNN